jgi:hypothetical protein
VRGAQTGFEGTIASACDFGIGIDNFIAMTRLTRTAIPELRDSWMPGTFGPAKQQARS